MPWTDKPSGSQNSGPWGRPEGSNGNGGGPRGGRGGAPDLEELLRSGRERFGRGGRGGGGGAGAQLPAPSGRLIGLALFVGLALYAFSGLYQVAPGSRGVVTTFGNFTGLTDPGLNWHLPRPFQSVEVVAVEEDRPVRIGGSSNRISMLTSDLNIVDVGLQVNYRIKSDATWSPESGDLPNAGKFIFNIEEPDDAVKISAEAALREVVGANEFEPIISSGRRIVNEETARILQDTLDGYNSGIEVIRVNFGQADPPQQVIPAQRDVIDATSEAEREVNVATGYANQKVPRATGEARQIVLDAEAYSARVVAQARGDAARFNAIYEEYAKAPDVTRQRMYLETMETVLGDMNKVLIDDDAGGTLPYLNLNELAREAQRSSARANNSGAQ
ncbi:MAG: FtsH protease activity modulator HflK [Pseudomonadota bacterium]